MSFNSEQELDDFLLGSAMNMRFSKVEVDPEKVSSFWDKLQSVLNFVDLGHRYFYKDTHGVEIDMTPTSNIVKEKWPFGDKNSVEVDPEAHNPTRDGGTYFHWFADRIIKNMNIDPEKPLHNLDFVDNDYDNTMMSKEERKEIEMHTENWSKQIINLYNSRLNPMVKGKRTNIVKSEVRIGTTISKPGFPNGISGTLDVVVITPDGKHHTYDYKFSKKPYGDENDKKNTKLKSNNLQQNIYRRLMELGDKVLGMPSLALGESYIVYVKLDLGDTSRKGADGNPLKEGEGIRQTVKNLHAHEIININDPIFQNFSAINMAYIKTIIPTDREIADTAKGITVKGKTDFGQLSNITGMSQSGTISPEAKAKSVTPFKASNSAMYQFKDMTNKNKKFTGTVAQKDETSKGDEARLKQMIEYYTSVLGENGGNIGNDAVTFFNSGTSGIFAEDKNSSGSKLKSNVQISYEKVFAGLHGYPDGADFAVLAENLPGFENVGSDVIFVYRDYSAEDQSSSSVRIISMVNGDLEAQDVVDKYLPSNRKSIFGSVATDDEVERAIGRAGVQEVTIMDRTNRSDRLLKLGLIEMKLKKDNPKIRIDNVIAGSYSEFGKHNAFVTAGQGNLMKHFKVLLQLKNDGVNVSDSLSPDVLEILNDKNLYMTPRYGQNETAFYISVMADAMNQRHRENSTEEQSADELKARYNLHQLGQDASKFMDLKKQKDLFGLVSGKTPQEIRDMVELIQKDEVKVQELLTILQFRQNKLMEDKNYLTNTEFKLLSNAIVQINGMRNDLDNVKDIGSGRSKYASLPGMTGITIVDQFVVLVKSAKLRIAMKFKETYLKEKRKNFTAFLEMDNILSKARNFVLGDTTAKYESLLEKKTFRVMGTDTTETRATGRFWPKGSPEYAKLDTRSKDFIEFFNKTVKENLTRNMTEPQKVKFAENWEEGWIPLMKASMKNLGYKLTHSTGTDEGVKKKLENIKDRFMGSYENYEQFFESATDGNKVIANFFTVGKNTGEERFRRMGFARMEGSDEVLINPQDKVFIETNLERVLDSLVGNSLTIEENSKLIPLFHAIKSGILASGEKYAGRDGYKNIFHYFDVYVKGAVFDEKQIGNPIIERTLNFITSLTSGTMTSFKMASGIKNLAAGGFIAFGNTLATAYGDGSANAIKGWAKMYSQVFSLVNTSTGTGDKYHSAMSSMGLNDSDIEKLTGDARFKVGSRDFSEFGAIANIAGDYLNRTIMVGSRMEMDGTINAYTKVGDDWIYDETKDPRFKKEGGAKLLLDTKEQMRKDGLLTPEGKMKVPYTMNEILEMKQTANLLFEALSSDDQALYKMWAVGRTFLSMNGWSASKLDSWLARGQQNAHFAKEVTEDITNDDGTTETVTHLPDGSGYFEGQWYTFRKVIQQAFAGIKDRDMAQYSEYWKNLTPQQKRNTINGMFQLAVMGGAAAIVAALFDKDEKKTLAYQMLINSFNEAATFAQVASMYKMVANPFPALSLARNTVSGMYMLTKDSDSVKGRRAVMQLLGPAKIYDQLYRMGNGS